MWLETLENPQSTREELINAAYDIKGILDKRKQQLNAVLLAYREDMMREMRGRFNADEFDNRLRKTMMDAIEAGL